ncbi:MAG: PKD domain-containing protein, partial [Methanobacteriota archaeon]
MLIVLWLAGAPSVLPALGRPSLPGPPDLPATMGHATCPLPAGHVRILETGDQFCAIQPAIDAASAGETVLVEPGTYGETISIDKAIRVCSGPVGGAACEPEALAASTRIHAPQPVAVLILSDDVVFEGLTVRMFPVGNPSVGFSLGGHDGVRLAHNIIRMPAASFVAPGPNTSVGIDSTGSEAAEIVGNTIEAGTVEQGGIGGNYGIRGTFTGSTIEENSFFNWEVAVSLGASTVGGNDVKNNDFDNNRYGVETAAAATTVLGNSFDVHVNAVTLRGDGTTTGSSAGTTMTWNRVVTDRFGLAVAPEVDGLAIDARFNFWPAHTRPAIRPFIDDQGEGNAIDISCFIDLDGVTPVCPPLVDFSFTPSGPIWGHEVDFFDGTQPNPRALVGFHWLFGDDGSETTEQDPSHTFALPGVYPVTLTVTDAEGYEASTTELVPVANNAPVLAAIGDRTVAENQVLSFAAGALDPDGDALTWTASGLPPGATLGPSSGLFQWAPTFAQAGVYPGITLSVTDGNLGDSETITITVVDQPQPPVAGISGPRYVRPGVAATWTSTSYDVDGPLAYQNWTATDGFLGSGASVTHAFALQGTYTLDLLVT